MSGSAGRDLLAIETQADLYCRHWRYQSPKNYAMNPSRFDLLGFVQSNPGWGYRQCFSGSILVGVRHEWPWRFALAPSLRRPVALLSGVVIVHKQLAVVRYSLNRRSVMLAKFSACHVAVMRRRNDLTCFQVVACEYPIPIAIIQNNRPGEQCDQPKDRCALLSLSLISIFLRSSVIASVELSRFAEQVQRSV